MNTRRLLFVFSAFVILLSASACSSTKDEAAPLQTSTPSPVMTETPAPSPSPKASQTQSPSPSPSPSPTPSPAPVSAPNKTAADSRTIDHVVIVVEENHSYKQIVGNKSAPYMQSLIEQGALFTNAYAVTHPSQPNYFALFSGSTQNVKDDSCKGPFSADNLANELLKTGYTFAGYSEDMPNTGYTGCSYKGYARKHNPWAQFTNVPKELNRPMTDFPSDFAKLPTVSFVIPNETNDMHDGTAAQADSWLQKHLGNYVTWAKKNNSLLIVTWDEDDFSKENKIPVIFVGPMVKPGAYDEKINHYNILRTIEDMYYVKPLAHSAEAKPITNVWK